MDGQRRGRSAVDAQAAPRTRVPRGGKRRPLDGMPADEGEQGHGEAPAGPVVPPDEASTPDGLLPLAWGGVSTMTFAALAASTVGGVRPPLPSVPPFPEHRSRTMKSGDTASAGEQIQAKPVEEKPIQEKPNPEKPIQEKPIQEMPIQERQIQERQIQESQIQGTRLQEMPVQERAVSETRIQEAPVQKVSAAGQAADENLVAEIAEGRIARDERDGMALDMDLPPAETFEIQRVQADTQISVSGDATTFDDAPMPLRRTARHSVTDDIGMRPEEAAERLTADATLLVQRADEQHGGGESEGGLPPAIRPEGMTDGTHPEALARLVVVHDRGRVVGRTWTGDLVDFVLTGQPEVRLPDVEGGLVLEIGRMSRDDQGAIQRVHVDVDASTELIPADLFVEGPQIFVVGARNPADAAPLRLLRVEHVWLDTQPPQAPTFRPIAQEVTDALLSVSNLEDQAQLQYRAGGASEWVTAHAGSNLKGPGEVRQVDRAGNAGPASELPAHQMIHVLQSVPPTFSDAVL